MTNSIYPSQETSPRELSIYNSFDFREKKTQIDLTIKPQFDHLESITKAPRNKNLDHTSFKNLIQQSFDQFRTLIDSSEIHEGEALTLKKDLMASFAKYTRALHDHYPIYLKHHPNIQEHISHVEKQLPTRQQIERKMSSTEKQADTILRGKPLSTSKKITTASLKVVQISLDHHQKIAIRDCSILSSGLSIGTAIPLALLSTYQMIQSAWQRQSIHKRLEECKKLQEAGNKMQKEGESLKAEAKALLEKPFLSQEEMQSFIQILEKSTELLTIGSELEEKASITELEIQKELEKTNLVIFNLSVATLIDLPSIANNIASLINKVNPGTISASALNTLSLLGIATSAISLVMSSHRTVKTIQAIHKTDLKIQEVYKKFQTVQALKTTNPMFYTMELTHLSQEVALLKTELRNQWISLANNLLLIVAGILGLVASVTAGVATAGIPYAVLAITLLTAMIIFGQHYIKTEWKKGTDPIDTWELWRTTNNWEPIMNYLALKGPDRLKFEKSPRIYLEQYFKLA